LELSLRTNQFNLTGRRLRQSEPLGFAAVQGNHVWLARVSDRFGDYGWVGLVLAQAHGDTLRISDFLLSCRSMGRGVEHAIVRHAGKVAGTLGLCSIELQYRATARNEPALKFLESLAHVAGRELGLGKERSLLLSVEQAMKLEVQYAAQAPRAEEQESASSTASLPPARFGYLRIAQALSDVEKIHLALEKIPKGLGRKRRKSSRLVEPETDMEHELCRMWQRLLQVDRIGVRDSFFDLGGHSLLAVRLASEVRSRFQVDVGVRFIFEYPTIRDLAAFITSAGAAAAPSQGHAAVAEFHEIEI
jgi:acyl carrier protein